MKIIRKKHISKNQVKEEVLWKGKWIPNDGHLINIKKSLDTGIKYGTSAPLGILKGERGLEFYFGSSARKILNYFMGIGFSAIGGPLKYKGKTLIDVGDLNVLANNLNKMNFMPSANFIQWVNSD
jgi:hypothetical protein